MRAILAGLAGLVLDDGALALGLVLWCASVGLGAATLPVFATAWGGAALLGGCLVLLLRSVLRAARPRG